MMKENFVYGALKNLKCLLDPLQFTFSCDRSSTIDQTKQLCLIMLFAAFTSSRSWWKYWQRSWPPCDNVHWVWCESFILFFPCFSFKDASVTEKDVFGLDGQIEHKLAFLRKHVPQGTNLLLIGHSIGCYIILEMIKRDPDLKV